jgi:glycosyltransferase involved in cell wall biosynthesis
MIKEKIKILQFSYVINRSDFIDTIIRFADREKFEFVAVSISSESNIEEPNFSRIFVKHLTFGYKMNLLGILGSVFKLAGTIQKERPQIIHSHHYYESLIAMLAIILSFRKTKLVIGRHYHDELYRTTKGVKLKIYLGLEKLANCFSSVIIVPSKDIQTLLIEQKVPTNKIKHVPYGFDFSNPKYQFVNSDKLKALKYEFKIGNQLIISNISRQSIVKGQRNLLKAFQVFVSENPDTVLFMVGDGLLNTELKQQCEELGLQDKVIFTGWRKDAMAFIDLADLVIHPTEQEAFPQIMIEVMAKGKLLIIPPVSGANDVIRSFENGYLLSDNSPEMIYKALSWFVDHRMEAKSVAEKAACEVRSKYAIERIVKSFEQEYLNLVQ